MTATQTNDVPLPTYKPKDFASDQEVRWCPGCGDYAVLKGVQKAAAKLGRRKEDFVFISGIGCAARFPYYMNTYGMHTIHGRAPAVATGVKLANPDLTVCVVSGDGDLLSIGGNHTMHAIRRNMDITILLLNNRIYGLTKGQYSPTSEPGKKTKSTPLGSLDFPINPLGLALGAGCKFIARTLDVDLKLFDEVYTRGLKFEGCAFIEVYQDCNIFNHGTYFYASQKDTKPENTVMLRHGEPMIFGKNMDKGLRRKCERIEVVELGGGVTEDELLVHDETNPLLAHMLAEMTYPEFPEPMGVIYANPDVPSYDELFAEQIDQAERINEGKTLEDLLLGEKTWRVEG